MKWPPNQLRLAAISHRGETIRIHHAIDHLQHYHPELAAHLRAAIRTGTTCTYQPAEPVGWNL
jgi:hypothetical protein